MFPIPWRLIGILLIFFAVGGTIYAGYTYVSNLQDRVIELEVENGELKDAVDGLEQQIVQLKEVQNDIESERDAALESDVKAQEAVRALELSIADKERQARIERIEESRRAGLYLRIIVKFEECMALHYDDFTGECNMWGKFKPIDKPAEEVLP